MSTCAAHFSICLVWPNFGQKVQNLHYICIWAGIDLSDMAAKLVVQRLELASDTLWGGKIHHRGDVPRDRGGSDHADNLQLLCGACNSVKGNRDQAYLVARLREHGVLA